MDAFAKGLSRGALRFYRIVTAASGYDFTHNSTVKDIQNLLKKRMIEGIPSCIIVLVVVCGVVAILAMPAVLLRVLRLNYDGNVIAEIRL